MLRQKGGECVTKLLSFLSTELQKIRSEEGLILETSIYKLFTVANLHYQLM